MNIVVINTFWRYPNTERWEFELITYDAFINHDDNHVSYIVNQRGLSAVPTKAVRGDVYCVEDISDKNQIETHIKEVIAKHGAIDRIIAFSENQLLLAAYLREKYSIPGPKQEVTELARDKVKMKGALAQTSIEVPRYLCVGEGSNEQSIKQFSNDVGFPLILKPTKGASSVGVIKIENMKELLENVSSLQGDEWELEEYIDGDIYHIDGIVDKDGEIIFHTTSRYINSCLNFSFENPLGSVLLPDDHELHLSVRNFTQECLSRLKFSACPFHLEAFRTYSGEWVFLEVGARVAGADVPYVIEKCTGVNLFEHWVALILNGKTTLQPSTALPGAWLMFGRPKELPKIVSAISDFRDQYQSLYRQLTPKLGSQLIDESGYSSMQSGRFLFCGQDTDSVMNDVDGVISNFKIKFE
ncbi:acetyl-CoA carboxylase biotin carboxylase subunit family protein [Vibrio lentus]